MSSSAVSGYSTGNGVTQDIYNTTLSLISSSIVSTNQNNSNISDFENAGRRVSIEDFLEYRIALIVALYIFPAIIIMGSAGNILALVVLCSARMRNTSVNIYLALLACADVSVLYFSAFKTWLRLVSDFELLHWSPAACKIIMFCFLLSLHMSAWLVVAMSADRFVAVWFPLRALRLCTPRRARIISLLSLLILCLYNSHVFWNVHLTTKSYGTRIRYKCGALPENTFIIKYYHWIKLATYSCVPFVLVLFLNVSIIIRILARFRHNDLLRADSMRTIGTTNPAGADHRVTAMLLVVSLSWLLLTAPFMLWTFIATTRADDYHQNAKDFLAKTISFALMYMNHAVNFYLYCITGARFRNELLRICRCTPSVSRIDGSSTARTTRMTSVRNGTRTNRPMTQLTTYHNPKTNRNHQEVHVNRCS